MHSSDRDSGFARGLAIELQVGGRTPSCLVVLSIPGRGGAVSRTWGYGPGGYLTAPQLEDISSWVLNALQEWLLGAVGVQQQMPL